VIPDPDAPASEAPAPRIFVDRRAKRGFFAKYLGIGVRAHGRRKEDMQQASKGKLKGSMPFVVVLVICFMIEMIVVGYLSSAGIIDAAQVKDFWANIFS
jgi:hypothetical protein